MEKVNFQNRMVFGMKKNREVFGKDIILEYTKVGSTTKIKETFKATFSSLEDLGLKDMTLYNKDSVVIKILCLDLLDKLKTIKVKNLNGIITMNNIKYNIVNEKLTSDEVQLMMLCNTVG